MAATIAVVHPEDEPTFYVELEDGNIVAGPRGSQMLLSPREALLVAHALVLGARSAAGGHMIEALDRLAGFVSGAADVL